MIPFHNWNYSISNQAIEGSSWPSPLTLTCIAFVVKFRPKKKKKNTFFEVEGEHWSSLHASWKHACGSGWEAESWHWKLCCTTFLMEIFSTVWILLDLEIWRKHSMFVSFMMKQRLVSSFATVRWSMTIWIFFFTLLSHNSRVWFKDMLKSSALLISLCFLKNYCLNCVFLPSLRNWVRC